MIVIVSQIFSGFGLAAGVTVGALLAQDMFDSDSLAGVPAALITLGSAASAFFIGKFSQRYGRRPGLATGFIGGGLGALGVVFAAVTDSYILLFASMLLYGAGTATNLQARYAGTDLAKPLQRATAISLVMVATTFGAVAGPNLTEWMGRMAQPLGIPVLAGPFLFAFAAFLIAGFVCWLFLRPDPLVMAQQFAESMSSAGSEIPHSPPKSVFSERRVVAGTAVMVLTQIVMVAVMTMTPVHMKHHGHDLSDVGFVISIHIGAMFLPSLITGILVDKIGRMTMSVASGCILLLSCIAAAVSPADSLFWLTVSLALLGLGWNLGLISGTAMIVDATPLATRAQTQGAVDVLLSIAGASGGALSGMVVAQTSFVMLSLAGGALSLLLIPVVMWTVKRHHDSKLSA